MEMRKIFANNLKRIRHERGMSQEELAYLAGLDRTYISSLERCVYSVSIDVIEKLSIVLNINPEELLKNNKK